MSASSCTTRATRFRSRPGRLPAGPVSLETLEAQHYILEDSRTGSAHLNYRRFFDVSSLAGVRVEVDSVFEAVLARALELVEDGTVDGLRIDHIDGLRDPSALRVRLRSRSSRGVAGRREDPRDRGAAAGRLADRRDDGYEFGALLTSLLVHP